MKHGKKLLMIFLAVCVLCCAVGPAAFAIGFDSEAIYASVFIVKAFQNNNASSYWFGSGFTIGENCFITNAHVILNERTEEPLDVFTITTYEGKTYDAKVRNYDARLDLAILYVPNVSFSPLQPADLSQLKDGDDVWAIGAPEGLEYTLTKGIISRRSRTVDGQPYIQTDTPINHGNSGGPLVNDRGEVLGVNTWGVSDANSLNFAIPISTVTQFLKDSGLTLAQDGTVIGSLNENGTQITARNSASNAQQGNSLLYWLIPAVIGAAAILLLIILGVSRAKKRAAAAAYPAYTPFAPVGANMHPGADTNTPPITTNAAPAGSNVHPAADIYAPPTVPSTGSNVRPGSAAYPAPGTVAQKAAGLMFKKAELDLDAKDTTSNAATAFDGTPDASAAEAAGKDASEETQGSRSKIVLSKNLRRNENDTE